MRFLRDLFSESNNASMMRLMALISLLIGGYLAVAGKNECVIIFISAAFGGKVAQKLTEIKKD